MNKEAVRLDISNTIRYYLPSRKQWKGFGEDDTMCALPAGDFAILSQEGGLKRGAPIKTDHFALVLCMRGHCQKTAGPFTFEVTPHTIHIITPRDFHSFENASDDLLLYMILFKKDFIANTFIKDHIVDSLLELNPAYPPLYHLDEQEFAAVLELFTKIEREYQHARPHYLQMVRLLVVELLYEIDRAHGKTLLQPVRHVGRPFQLTTAFRKLVEDHFLTIRTVQQYADLLHVTAKHLSEQVKHETGETALSLIHKRIYLEAQYLLGTASYSVKEIADLLNFDTSSHFSRFFKHYAGVRPTQYRGDALAV